MLINRRNVLISLGLTACSGVAWSLPYASFARSKEASENGGGQAAQPTSQDPVEANLRADLARIAARGYSEEGIPVFLACLNLVPAPAGQAIVDRKLTPFNASLAKAFQENADAFKRIRSDAKAQDVAPLIEILADRDFARGEMAEKA